MFIPRTKSINRGINANLALQNRGINVYSALQNKKLPITRHVTPFMGIYMQLVDNRKYE